VPQSTGEGLRPAYSTPDEQVDTPTINLVEFPSTRLETAEMLRAHSGDWFHRMQMESIGIRLAQSTTVQSRACDGFNSTQLESIGILTSVQN
jgi:hypothetical protein